MQLIPPISFKLWLVVTALLTTSPFSHAETCRANIPPSNPNAAYTIQDNVTVTHTPTGLMWIRCAEGQTWTGSTCTGSAKKFSWAQALKQAKTSCFAGHKDWRLPSVKELHSLVEECRSHPSINAAVFPGTPLDSMSSYFWSSSADSARNAWVVDFTLGDTSPFQRNDMNIVLRVRLVRGGQPFTSADDTTTPLLNLRLNDTGITEIFSDPLRQDGSTGRDSLAAAGKLTKTGGGSKGFDFTKIANDGSVLPDSAALGTGAKDWACTRDNVTGLMWEVKTTEGLRSQNHTYTWNLECRGTSSRGGTCFTSGRCETEKYAQDVNATGLCGASNWRMPHIKELEGIVHYGRSDPAIDSMYFPNTLSNSSFWSGTPNATSTSNAWAVGFGLPEFDS